MNQVVLFIIFILLGIFIFYILEDRCKCDVVEGQVSLVAAPGVVDSLVAAPGVVDSLVDDVDSLVDVVSHNPVIMAWWNFQVAQVNLITDSPETIASGASAASGAAEELRGLNFHQIQNGLNDSVMDQCSHILPHHFCKLADHFVDTGNSCSQLAVAPLGTIMTALSCAEDIGETVISEGGNYPLLQDAVGIFKGALTMNNELNPEIISHGIEAILSYINRSHDLGYDHTRGHCVYAQSWEGHDAGELSQEDKSDCIKTISKLAHEHNKETPDQTVINGLMDACRGYDTCKKIFDHATQGECGSSPELVGCTPARQAELDAAAERHRRVVLAEAREHR